MRHTWKAACAAASIAVLAGCSGSSSETPPPSPRPYQASVALAWDETALQAIRDTRPAPPVAARALFMMSAGMYSAWSVYQPHAKAVYGQDVEKRPASEVSAAALDKAVSHAAYHVLLDLFPTEKGLLDQQMTRLGFDPADTTQEEGLPQGIGNHIAAHTLEDRHLDGANQMGDLAPGPYADYTHYAPANPPLVVGDAASIRALSNPDRWQPLTYVDAAGKTVTQAFALPQWNRVEPFALTDPGQFAPAGAPAKAGTQAYRDQVDEIVALSGGLTDEQKAIVEHWADGPGSDTPPGHWNRVAIEVGKRDRHSLEQDLEMLLALNGAELDASIAAWDCKVGFDSVRPISAVRYLEQGRTIQAWGGPGQGTKGIDGALWMPYQAAAAPTPAFAECVSGHSTFSAAAAEVLARVAGSDAYAATVLIPKGALKFDGGAGPAQDLALSWTTFTEMADQAGMSRRYGGIHFKDGDLWGRAMGRQVGAQAYERAKAYWTGQ